MQIQVNGISCMAVIGCHDYERKNAQEIILDVSCDLYDISWHNRDSLDETLCFDVLLEHVRQIVSGTNYHLLESLSTHLTSTIFNQFQQVRAVELKLFKPNLCGLGAKERVIRSYEARKFKIAIALGSNNIYLPQQQMISAIEILGGYLDNIQIGGFYETKPIGFTSQRNFYNTAIIATTTLCPKVLFSKLKKTEKLLGKEEIMIDGPRIIDLDLIFVNDIVYQENFMVIPHIAMHERDFVLKPLVDICPDWKHPLLNKTVQELLADIPLAKRSILRRI